MSLNVVLNLEKEGDFIPWLHQYQDKVVLVKFFTTWCTPCQVLQKNLEKLLIERAESKQPDLVVIAVDADRFPALKYHDQEQKVQQLVVYSVPVLFLFRLGKKVKEEKGALNIEQLREFINNY